MLQPEERQVSLCLSLENSLDFWSGFFCLGFLFVLVWVWWFVVLFVCFVVVGCFLVQGGFFWPCWAFKARQMMRVRQSFCVRHRVTKVIVLLGPPHHTPAATSSSLCTALQKGNSSSWEPLCPSALGHLEWVQLPWGRVVTQELINAWRSL